MNKKRKVYNDNILKILSKRENLFKNYSKFCNMSPTEHWIVYTIYNGNKKYTQKDLATEWSFPKQTINTAVKKLHQHGLVNFKIAPGFRREKYIFLTNEGRTLGEKIIKPLIEAEIEAFSDFNNQERELFMSLLFRWVENLEKGMKTMMENEVNI